MEISMKINCSPRSERLRPHHVTEPLLATISHALSNIFIDSGDCTNNTASSAWNRWCILIEWKIHPFDMPFNIVLNSSTYIFKKYIVLHHLNCVTVTVKECDICLFHHTKNVVHYIILIKYIKLYLVLFFLTVFWIVSND